MRSGLFSRRSIRPASVLSVGSAKIKLLLACCALFTVIALSGRTASWSQYTVSSSRSHLPRTGYTLLINTWKRNDLLKQSISHYASCPGLDSVHIVWSEPDHPQESLVSLLNQVLKSNAKDGREIELKFDINKEDSLNNRFKEIKDLKTDVVFSIDDDIIFPCATVEFAFNVWQSAPDTMVGFVPRIHQKGELNKYIYSGWWSVWWTGTYSMILSKAAFFHKKYLRIYTHEMPSSIREYVTRNRNCEDIAMSFLVANATGVPPIWVKGSIFEIGSTGISSLGGHNDRRTQCINRFAAQYNRMPLVPTSVKAVDSRHTWLW
ncbi:glycosylinositol phosphorylceramide mannosyl transferase 1 isoform X2 [Andrographis paniculata]|uniref:glycosylinositol phosphorylceramide mannosyl transferase 1 isoform X2 n=1 Tax=Andrographis paniculata TaxID=175694 RepID=UPI0021E87FDE|nr:glycosylinositol phosphorylceramide mannosyl transferase 1 isoform X2 [Andrographis paniculata]